MGINRVKRLGKKSRLFTNYKNFHNYSQRYFCWKGVVTLPDGWKTEQEPVGWTEFDMLSEGWRVQREGALFYKFLAQVAIYLISGYPGKFSQLQTTRGHRIRRVTRTNTTQLRALVFRVL